MPPGPRRALRQAVAEEAAPAPGADAADARTLERAMRPLVDAHLAAAETLEERVSPVHLRALQALERLGPSHVSGLAATMSLLPSTVSRLSDRLTAAGLITRGVSPVNRRATLLELTPSGREVLAELTVLRVERVHAVLRVMTPRDRRRLVAGMQAFAVADARVARHDPATPPDDADTA